MAASIAKLLGFFCDMCNKEDKMTRICDHNKTMMEMLITQHHTTAEHPARPVYCSKTTQPMAALDMACRKCTRSNATFFLIKLDGGVVCEPCALQASVAMAGMKACERCHAVAHLLPTTGLCEACVAYMCGQTDAGEAEEEQEEHENAEDYVQDYDEDDESIIKAMEAMDIEDDAERAARNAMLDDMMRVQREEVARVARIMEGPAWVWPSQR
jgi:hypothetical protein